MEYIISHIKIKHIVIYNKGYSSNTLMLLSKLSHKYNIKLMDVRQVSSFKLGDSSFLFLIVLFQIAEIKMNILLLL